jgi:hypothetical protein
MNVCSYVECVLPSIENGNSDDARVLAGPAACKIYSGAKPPSPESTERFMWHNQEKQSGESTSRAGGKCRFTATQIMHMRGIELKELSYVERETSGGNAGSSLQSPSIARESRQRRQSP